MVTARQCPRGGACNLPYTCTDIGPCPAEPVVIIGCGASKRPVPAPAADLYTGQHFRAAMAAAFTLAPRRRCFVLSARYGIVPLQQVIAPYDLTIGQPGSVTAAHVAEDAKRLGLDGAARVVILASARYAALCRAVWPDAQTPLAGLPIGYARQALARIREEGLAA